MDYFKRLNNNRKHKCLCFLIILNIINTVKSNQDHLHNSNRARNFSSFGRFDFDNLFILRSSQSLPSFNSRYLTTTDVYECNPSQELNITETKSGVIKSPNYPKPYRVPAYCKINIFSNRQDDIITIGIDHLNIENNEHDSPIRCMTNHLTIQDLNINNQDFTILKDNDHFRNSKRHSKQKKYCGNLEKSLPSPYISDTNSISIIFEARTNHASSIGFKMTFKIIPKNIHQNRDCLNDEFKCKNGKCIPNSWKCNGRNECGDHTDESNCNKIKFNDKNHSTSLKLLAQNHLCKAGEFSCLVSYPTLFECKNITHICDGIPDCIDSLDEMSCGQHCPVGLVQCGSMPYCYDPKIHRCNRHLDCPNGADELNCSRQFCPNKILCQSGDGCYDLRERCNGIVQCADYSDEKNCTLELCRPDKGSFLCSNGRCIPSVWTCDRSADCFDGSDEIRCLKNSIITAAIMGSMFCALLIVIAISCGCKLIALKHLERYRNTLNCSSHNNHHSSNNSPNDSSSQNGCSRNTLANGSPMHHHPYRLIPDMYPLFQGDLDASLFRLEHSIMFREPPPSYASTMGEYNQTSTIPNQNTDNHLGYNNLINYNSYIEQYRRYRRQRRCRRMLRRQYRLQQQNQLSQQNSNDSNSSSVNQEDPLSSPSMQNITNQNLTNQTIVNHNYQQQLQDQSPRDVTTTCQRHPMANTKDLDQQHPKEEQDKAERNGNYLHNQVIVIDVTDNNTNSNNLNRNSTDISTHNHPNMDNLNIELEPLTPTLINMTNQSNFDCDSQPLIK